MLIIQLTINELWFFGHFLTTSVAWCENFDTLAVYLGNILHSEFLISSRSLNLPFFWMALLSYFSCLATVYYYYYHVKYEHKNDKSLENASITSVVESSSSEMDVSLKPLGKAILNRSLQLDKLKYKQNFPGKTLPPVLASTKSQNLNRFISISPDLVKPIDDDDAKSDKSSLSELATIIEEEVSRRAAKESVVFGFKSIRYYSRMFWLLCTSALFLRNCYSQLMSIITEILQNRYMYKFEDANQFTIIPDIAFIAVAPFISHYVEEKGLKPHFLMIASACYLVSFTFMYFLPPQPTLLLIPLLSMHGVAYAIVTCALMSSPGPQTQGFPNPIKCMFDHYLRVLRCVSLSA